MTTANRTSKMTRLPSILLATTLMISAPINAQTPVGKQITRAQSADGSYISWREHIIDDPALAGFALSGSDGLVMADLDRDGFEDIISVHESDSEYDSGQYDPDFIPPPEGHVRIAFGSDDPQNWKNITVAEGEDAPAPEDVAAADINGDGYIDLIVAAELSHLLYLENPGPGARSETWQRLILPMTRGRGSYIRVFMADIFGDSAVEVLAPNKGAQRPGPPDYARSTPVSVFSFTGDPLSSSAWQETVIGNYSIPQNSEPVDLDGDGDMDIIIGTRGENRLAWFENQSTDSLQLIEHAIGIVGAAFAGFNLEYHDLSGDGRLDIIGASAGGMAWIEQPETPDDAWNAFTIGSFFPDSTTGMELADIDNDGDMDVIAGSYSRGSRTGDGEVTVNDPLGRIGWYENPGDAKEEWIRHDISRRKRGMFDKFIARDIDRDGDIDFVATRGNSAPYDGVFWLEQVRTPSPTINFQAARENESAEMALP